MTNNKNEFWQDDRICKLLTKLRERKRPVLLSEIVECLDKDLEGSPFDIECDIGFSKNSSGFHITPLKMKK